MFEIRSNFGKVPGATLERTAMRVARWMSARNPGRVYAIVAPSGETLTAFKRGYEV